VGSATGSRLQSAIWEAGSHFDQKFRCLRYQMFNSSRCGSMLLQPLGTAVQAYIKSNGYSSSKSTCPSQQTVVLWTRIPGSASVFRNRNRSQQVSREDIDSLCLLFFASPHNALLILQLMIHQPPLVCLQSGRCGREV
jgi:hypothetical protein